MTMNQFVRTALEEAGIPVIDEAGLSPKAPSFAPIPALHPLVRDALSREYPGGLYSHQSAAIEAGLNGRNGGENRPTIFSRGQWRSSSDFKAWSV